MNSNKRFVIWLWPMILAFVSIGCGLSGVVGNLGQSDPTPTRRVAMLPTFTPTPELIFVQPTSTPVQPTAEQLAEPTPTLPPTPAPTLELESEPQNDGTVTVTTNQDMNVRGGPGTNYPILGTAPAGASSTVVGRNAENSWLQVEYPPGTGNTGWIYAQLVTASGNTETVAVAQAPPPPPAPAPQPTAQQEPPPPPPPPEKKYQFMPAAWSASENKGICHFRGTIRDSGGNPVSGYSVLVDNGSYSVMSHPSSASHHYPETVDGQWDVSGIPLKDCVGWWWLTVVKYECPDFQTKFDAQCKQFTRLSEDIKIEVDYPRHTVIWADWTCQWDCDKGVYNVPYRK